MAIAIFSIFAGVAVYIWFGFVVGLILDGLFDGEVSYDAVVPLWPLFALKAIYKGVKRLLGFGRGDGIWYVPMKIAKATRKSVVELVRF